MFYAIMNTVKNSETEAFENNLNQVLREAKHCLWQSFNHPHVIIILSVAAERTGWLEQTITEAGSGTYRIFYYSKWLTDKQKKMIKAQKKDKFPGPEVFLKTKILLRRLSELQAQKAR